MILKERKREKRKKSLKKKVEIQFQTHKFFKGRILNLLIRLCCQFYQAFSKIENLKCKFKVEKVAPVKLPLELCYLQNRLVAFKKFTLMTEIIS